MLYHIYLHTIHLPKCLSLTWTKHCDEKRRRCFAVGWPSHPPCGYPCLWCRTCHTAQRNQNRFVYVRDYMNGNRTKHDVKGERREIRVSSKYKSTTMREHTYNVVDVEGSDVCIHGIDELLTLRCVLRPISTGLKELRPQCLPPKQVNTKK